jgi:hypothetical protein
MEPCKLNTTKDLSKSDHYDRRISTLINQSLITRIDSTEDPENSEHVEQVRFDF